MFKQFFSVTDAVAYSNWCYTTTNQNVCALLKCLSKLLPHFFNHFFLFSIVFFLPLSCLFRGLGGGGGGEGYLFWVLRCLKSLAARRV